MTNGLTTTTDTLLQITQFEYNDRSQITKVTDASDQGYDFTYDALGRRTKRTQGSTVTKFICDGLDVLADDNAETLTKYLNGLGIDNKLRVQTGSSVNYFLTDHLGSTNGLANSSGSVTSSTNYDSFGNATNTSFPTRYQYTGREFDSFTGLHYYRNRWYDAQLGRFISEDPIGFAGGDTNLFAYAWNNTQNWTDPSGLIPFKLPPNPGNNGSNLPPGWKHVPEHLGGDRWISPNGDEGVEFHPGTPGENGFEGKDHWHKLKPNKNGKMEKDKAGGRKGGHYLPGDEVELKNCFSSVPNLSQPTLEELRLQEQSYQEMEKFWWKVTLGGAAVGTVLTGGALGAFGGAAGTTSAAGATAGNAGGWGLLPALGF